MTTRRAAALQVALLTTGCSNLLAPIESATTTALIDKLPQDVPKATRSRGVLLVATPTCRPVYDTVRMAYSLHEHHVDFFARHEWAERPAQMLQPLIVRTLEAARCCVAVVTPPSVSYNFSLRTDIRELVQDFSTDPPRLRLALRLVVGVGNQPVATHDIEFAEPMSAKNPEAGVAAANDAAAKAMRALARKVIDAAA